MTDEQAKAVKGKAACAASAKGQTTLLRSVIFCDRLETVVIISNDNSQARSNNKNHRNKKYEKYASA